MGNRTKIVNKNDDHLRVITTWFRKPVSGVGFQTDENRTLFVLTI